MNIPIYKALIKYASSGSVSFHMPGHKLGKGIPEVLLKNLTYLDLTEIYGMDNLHDPKGIIKEAQELASDTFGSYKSYFLVNGSTCGIHSMILATCKRGDRLIVNRDCHKAVINGMILAGVEPVYIEPELNMEFGISAGISTNAVEKAIMRNPEAIGIFITRPNYYGICCDIKEVAKVVHKYGKLLLVDEAHGAHLRFSKDLPVCAMDAGADICVQSAHKTLPAFTQGSYLHIKGEKIDVHKLEEVLAMIQTSSPSYVIMAMLDISRDIMEREGAGKLEELLINIDNFRKEISDIKSIKLLQNHHEKRRQLDRTRLTINTKGLGITGFEAGKLLKDEFNIWIEMADYYNIVCISTISDEENDFTKLANALREISLKYKRDKKLADIHIESIGTPVKSISLGEVNKLESRKVKLKDSIGEVSKGLITPYPPGIPLLCPGEIITKDIVEYLLSISTIGGDVNGVDENDEIYIIK